MKLTAEIGGNHTGELRVALGMIQMLASFCKVPCVKFQKRTIAECLTPEEYNSPHPVERNSYGRTYGEHRSRLEFDLDQHRILKKCCEDHGIEYACSVWDLTSAREIVSLEPTTIKVPSACNTHYALAEYLCDEFAGEIHVSLGMVEREDVRVIVEFYAGRQRISDVVLYHCVSGYPIEFEDTHLLEIEHLNARYGGLVKGIGLSGHHQGISLDNAALALGARYFERHFTLNRTWKGTDHAASLEPDGMRRLWRNLQSSLEGMTVRPHGRLPAEQDALRKLKWDRPCTGETGKGAAE